APLLTKEVGEIAAEDLHVACAATRARERSRTTDLRSHRRARARGHGRIVIVNPFDDTSPNADAPHDIHGGSIHTPCAKTTAPASAGFPGIGTAALPKPEASVVALNP